MVPYLETPWRNQKQTKMEDIFLRLLCLWDEKSIKPGQIQVKTIS